VEKLLAPLNDHQALLYDADPKGMLSARRAVGDLYYADHNLHVSPEQIVITTSTSEGYGYLFSAACPVWPLWRKMIRFLLRFQSSAIISM